MGDPLSGVLEERSVTLMGMLTLAMVVMELVLLVIMEVVLLSSDALSGALEAVESVKPMLMLSMVDMDSDITLYLETLSSQDLPQLDITQEELSAAASDQLNPVGDITTMPFLETPLSDDLESDTIQEVYSAVS